MINVKGFAIANDGDMKRIAITYDKVDDVTGKPIEQNVKVSNFITDKETLEALFVVDSYVHSVINGK